MYCFQLCKWCRYKDGSSFDVMKNPVATGKSSFPGALAVKRVNGVPTTFPADSNLVSEKENLLQVVYDHGPLKVTLPFLSIAICAWLCHADAIFLYCSSGRTLKGAPAPAAKRKIKDVS